MVMSTLVFSIASGGIVKRCRREHGYQVCQLTRFDGSLDRFLVFSEGGSHGVGMDSLRNANALLGDPAVWIFTVEEVRRVVAA